MRSKPNCEASVKLLLGVRSEQQPCRADDSRQNNGSHEDKIGADFVAAQPAHRHRESVEVEEEGICECHGHQSAHASCVGADFCKIVEEKSAEKCNRGAKHHDDHRFGYQWVALEIDEHPEVKNAGEDVRADALKAVFELHGLHHVERFHDKNRKKGHRKRREEDHQHQFPLPENVVYPKLVGVHQQQQQQHVGQHEQGVEKDGNDMGCCTEHSMQMGLRIFAQK